MQNEKIRLLIVEDNLQECRAFQDCIERMDDIELVGVTGSAEQALKLMEQFLPNAIILDLELEEGDGVDFFYKCMEKKLPVTPYVVVTTNITSEITLKGLHENGVGMIFSKHIRNYNPQQVLNKFVHSKKYILSRDKEKQGTTKIDPARIAAKSMRQMISDELGEIGITTKIDANIYLTEAIMLARERINERWAVSKWLYTTVAQICNTNKDNVEHSIRIAIQNAWKNSDSDVLREHYTQATSSSKGCPTNKEFITYFARKY